MVQVFLVKLSTVVVVIVLKEVIMIGSDYKDMFFVTAYGPKRRDVVVDASEKFGAGARQSFKDECDINNIMKKYQVTGVIDWVAKYEGSYSDLTGYDFMESQLIVAKASEMFADLPSSVRKRFQNDPGEFLEFMSDESNSEEAIKLGLATRRQEPAVVAPPVEVPAS